MHGSTAGSPVIGGNVTFTKDDTYKHSVLEVSQRINGGCMGGTSDPLPDEELQSLSDWLYWRVMEKWSPTPSRRLEIEAYDQAVWNLAMAAVSMARHELERRNRKTLPDRPLAPPVDVMKLEREVRRNVVVIPREPK